MSLVHRSLVTYNRLRATSDSPLHGTVLHGLDSGTGSLQSSKFAVFFLIWTPPSQEAEHSVHSLQSLISQPENVYKREQL